MKALFKSALAIELFNKSTNINFYDIVKFLFPNDYDNFEWKLLDTDSKSACYALAEGKGTTGLNYVTKLHSEKYIDYYKQLSFDLDKGKEELKTIKYMGEVLIKLLGIVEER